MGKHDFSVAFKDMDVEMPILSVRKMVIRQNDVRFAEGGGTITHRKTKRTLPLFEYEGAYFVKLKVGKSKVSDPMAADVDDVADFMDIGSLAPFQGPEP